MRRSLRTLRRERPATRRTRHRQARLRRPCEQFGGIDALATHGLRPRLRSRRHEEARRWNRSDHETELRFRRRVCDAEGKRHRPFVTEAVPEVRTPELAAYVERR